MLYKNKAATISLLKVFILLTDDISRFLNFLQSRAAVALDVYQAIRNLSGDDSKEPTTVTISCDAVGEAAPNAFPEAFPHVAELELEEMREKLRATMAEKELIKQQLENASTKARKDFVVKMEDVVENELQCGICSELLVFVSKTTLLYLHD